MPLLVSKTKKSIVASSIGLDTFSTMGNYELKDNVNRCLLIVITRQNMCDIMLDFDMLHVPCGHNDAHSIYIEEKGKTLLPICGRHRTYRKYFLSANKLTITIYAPNEVRVL